MKNLKHKTLESRIKNWIILFILFLIASGITAFPLETELSILEANSHIFPQKIQVWLSAIYISIKETNTLYPHLSYGTDWLAFSHLVIATAFIGPLKDPVKNIWVVQFGMIACLMVFPLALIAGPIRNIPFFWQLINCLLGYWDFFLSTLVTG